jgi:hypothetical protein
MEQKASDTLSTEMERYPSAPEIAQQLADILANSDGNTQITYVRQSGGLYIEWLGIDGRWEKESITVGPSDVTPKHKSRVIKGEVL